ncbi:multidrug ABC transporter ATP-binding protein [Mesotoga sp. Brook.08.YT.4.2.5.1]|uniref:ABC transporter ATP-binding protein n=1 Tax=unclassified Mesotoga TaxID=1184398 RepID=UPI000C1995BE|nr:MULTISPECIES: ABC transporter ATP-binding protein [unclassified Mesotoga]PNE18071.1 multidrug ABC transporter ATP-binding protein [Mesotoga sp. Brook.08.YT.4.2.5.1]PNS41251.1 multidrug ABC transporter ATP-binding protein [Mesotoga sp. B105.6.4]PVD16980.1 ABC transporter [Mesotoga sp. Brook.08.105.5.1]RDI93457.1 multidrug ABC transporter ATP-binding protein [Mesotoga sp. Brook.08.YT.4.2.5.2.]
MSSDNREKGRGHRGRGGGPMGPGMMRAGEKAKDFRGTLKKLVQYLKKYQILIIIVFCFAAAGALFSIMGPKILGTVTTEVFEGIMAKITGTGEGINFDSIARTMFILLGLYALSALFMYIQGWIMSGISAKVTYKFREEISHKINRLPLKYFDKSSQGDVLSRVTNDVDTISRTLNQSLSQIITSITTVVGVTIMMFTISWQLTLIALLILPVSMGLIAFVVKLSQRYFKKQQEYLGKVNGHVEEMYGGHVVVKAFNGEEKSIETFDKLNAELYDSAWKSQFLSGMMMPIMTFVGNLGYVLITIMGGWFAVRNMITVGDIQAFIQYVRSFTQPIAQIANIMNVFQQTAAAAERVFEFLEEEEEIPETTNPVKGVDHHGHVEFRNVRFGYVPEKTIIKNFSCEVDKGHNIAIVGPTGAGKTTIVKLLMRFYDVTSGEILLDGHNIKDYTRHDLRENFGMVLQDTWLYNASIWDNIKYGRLDATDEEVLAAAKAAHVESFIHTLPEGYNLVLNEEQSNISQGQKQLITIARAILADPKVLILDEATSSVDTRTEALIQQAMKNLMKNRTSFMIAHRLSTIRDADLILVMNEGDIVEQGTHKELLARGGFYAELYTSQFESDFVEAV